jgi:hypothetical protein
MKNERLKILEMVRDNKISIEDASDSLLGLSNITEYILSCPKCKDYYGYDTNRSCFNCGTKVINSPQA